jgi:hypothetical protein
MVQGVAAGSIERSVIPAGNSTYRIVFQLPQGTVAGITENFPAGMAVSDISLNPGQYQVNGTTLAMAVIGESEVSYLVSTQPGDSGEISGTFLDMLTGERSVLPGARISGSGTIEITPAAGTDLPSGEEGDEHPLSLEPGVGVIALGAIGIFYSLRRRTQ